MHYHFRARLRTGASGRARLGIAAGERSGAAAAHGCGDCAEQFGRHIEFLVGLGGGGKTSRREDYIRPVLFMHFR
jgi:hypothetical protein